jgi:DNA helicase HerA-like ATPase
VAGRQTFRILIVGKSGSGKSTLARQIIRRMEGRYRHLIIVNRKREFAELAEGRYTVREEGDPTPALRQHRRVIFQVTGYDPRPFLDQLGQAIMRLRDVLLVVDEAHHFFPRGQTPKGLFEVLTGGREYGHSAIFITQMLQGATGGIEPGVRRQASHLIVFRVSEPREVQAVSDMFPELGEGVRTLARPEGGLPPEYGIKDLDRDFAGVVRRAQQGRVFVRLD